MNTMFPRAVIAAFLMFASYSVVASGGVAQGTGEGNTRAEACEHSIRRAEAAIYTKEVAKITFGGTYEITKKRCECDQVSESTAGRSRGWSCFAFVTYEFSEA